MKEPETPMYDKLAEYEDGRCYVTVFFGWIGRSKYRKEHVGDLDIQALIMEYLEIDMVALEKERLAVQKYTFC